MFYVLMQGCFISFFCEVAKAGKLEVMSDFLESRNLDERWGRSRRSPLRKWIVASRLVILKCTSHAAGSSAHGQISCDLCTARSAMSRQDNSELSCEISDWCEPRDIREKLNSYMMCRSSSCCDEETAPENFPPAKSAMGNAP